MEVNLIPNIVIGYTNNYPDRYCLPGDRNCSLSPVGGGVRQNIVHALTFYEIPPDVDYLIETLPTETELLALNPIQRDYLSFLVYTLKQMVAAGSISAEAAWTIFYGEWDNIGFVDEYNFAWHREELILSAESYYEGCCCDWMPLLELEFCLRAGEVGLDQFERYSCWVASLVFDEDSTSDMPKVVRDEYRKALWLGMRTLEDQYELGRLNDDLGTFVFNDAKGFYHPSFNGLEGAVNVFEYSVSDQFGNSIDSTMLAELGHWGGEHHSLRPTETKDGEESLCWASELTDRINMTGYTENGIAQAFQALAEGTALETLPPEARTFISGGYYLSSGRRSEEDGIIFGFPSYPQEFPPDRVTSYQKHETAERVEREIRRSVVDTFYAGDLEAEEVYPTYRRTGLYANLLFLEGNSLETILAKIAVFDLDEINNYYMNYEQIAQDALEEQFKSEEAGVRSRAATGIIWLNGYEEGTGVYKYFDAHHLIAAKKWSEVDALGVLALSALRSATRDRDYKIRGRAARRRFELGDYYHSDFSRSELDSYGLIAEHRFAEVVELGGIAIEPLRQMFEEQGNEYNIPGVRAAGALARLTYADCTNPDMPAALNFHCTERAVTFMIHNRDLCESCNYLSGALQDGAYEVQMAAAEELLGLKEVYFYQDEQTRARSCLIDIVSYGEKDFSGKAARILLNTGVVTKDDPDYCRLRTFQLVEEERWYDIVRLGPNAIPALEELLNYASYTEFRPQLVGVLGAIGDSRAASTLEMMLRDNAAEDLPKDNGAVLDRTE